MFSKNFIVLCFCLFYYPVLPGTASSSESTGEQQGRVLFEVERNRDSDKIYYEINLDADGRINRHSPVKVYWKRYSGNGEQERLTRVQQNYSYGLKYIDVNPLYAKFRFAASKERVFILKRNQTGEYRVYAQSSFGESELIKMYVHFAGGTFLAPLIDYIELILMDTETDKVFIEAFETK